MGRAVWATKVLRERERETHLQRGMTASKGAFGATVNERHSSHLTTGATAAT